MFLHQFGSQTCPFGPAKFFGGRTGQLPVKTNTVAVSSAEGQLTRGLAWVGGDSIREPPLVVNLGRSRNTAMATTSSNQASWRRGPSPASVGFPCRSGGPAVSVLGDHPLKLEGAESWSRAVCGVV